LSGRNFQNFNRFVKIKAVRHQIFNAFNELFGAAFFNADFFAFCTAVNMSLRGEFHAPLSSPER
jgi:hypothetical protein